MIILLEILHDLNFEEKIIEFKYNLNKSKKYLIIYLIFIIFISLTMVNLNNSILPVIIIAFSIVFGVFSITFFSYHKDKNLYKTAFVIIFLFGLLCCFLNPICNVSDEIEHFSRADITSRGILMPEYVNNGFEVSSYVPNFFDQNRALTVYQAHNSFDKIDNSLSSYPSAFQQNPFFGYMPQAIGMIIAKILDLDVIWLLWLGRVCNLLCYSLLVSYSIKKTPILKVPFLVTACIPLGLQQAASFSIDSIFFGLGFLTIAYFFYLCSSSENSIRNTQIIKYSILCLLLGLCKLPFFAMILLLFFINPSKFQCKNPKSIILFFIIILGGIALFWSQVIALPSYIHSWRANYYIQNNVNSSQQIHYILSHIQEFLISVFHIPNSLPYFFSELTSVYTVINDSAKEYSSGFVTAALPLFLGAVWLFYPKTKDINIIDRVGPLFVLLLVFYATALIQLISWGSVGDMTDIVIHARYYLPLFALIPFIFGINVVKKHNVELDYYIICLSVAFAASFAIKLATLYY